MNSHRNTFFQSVLAALIVAMAIPALSQETAPEPSAAPAPAPVDSRRTALVSSMVLKVLNPAEARASLKAQMKTLGGFATMVTDDAITFRCPPTRLNEGLEIIAKHGMLLEKSIGREDLTQQIASLEGQLKSRQEVLERLRTFFDGADFGATLDIENNMTSLVDEIEAVKGTLRVLNDRSKYAVIHISFRFETRDRIIYTRSPFEWLNTVTLETVTEDF